MHRMVSEQGLPGDIRHRDHRLVIGVYWNPPFLAERAERHPRRGQHPYSAGLLFDVDRSEFRFADMVCKAA
jgi:hypothetical protein